MMRISKDRADKAYSPSADQRRVWCNDREIGSWITADEFRRVVITSDNKVMNGSVRIERIAEDGAPPEPEHVLELPADVGWVGAGLVSDKPVPPTVAEIDQAAEIVPVVEETLRPEAPDEVVVVTQSERLPEDDSQE